MSSQKKIAALKAEREQLYAELRRTQEQRDQLRAQAEALHQIGHALGLPAGSDLTRDALPVIEALRKGRMLPVDWEDQVFGEMTRLFENRHVGRPGVEVMVTDDTQVGVEFACKQIAAMAAKEGV